MDDAFGHALFDRPGQGSILTTPDVDRVVGMLLGNPSNLRRRVSNRGVQGGLEFVLTQDLSGV